MNTDFKKIRIPLLTAGLGLAAAVLRTALYALGTDEKGLLIPGHPVAIGVWAVTAAAVIFTAAVVWKRDGSNQYEHNFASSTPAAIGCFALAGGIAATVLSGWGSILRLDLIRDLCGVLAIPALVAMGLRRNRGMQSFFLLHGMVCLYLTLYAVSHYQTWSSLPQLQDYFFAVLAAVLLPLFGYYQTAFDVGLGNRRMQLATGLLAAFFCIAALAGGADPLLKLGGAVWALTNLCSLTPVPKPEEPGHDPA